MKATEKSQPVIFEDIENRIIDLRGEKVLLDCDVAALYGVETKEVNQAVRNNVEKFPDGYVIALNMTEKQRWSKILTTSKISNFHLRFPRPLPKKACTCWRPF